MSSSSANPDIREALVKLVGDMLTEQPDDVLVYLQRWAGTQKQAATPKFRGTKSAQDALRARHARELPSCFATIEDAKEGLSILFARYKDYFQEKREGARDHYMMALEDSGYDIFHLRQLEAKIHAARSVESRVLAKETQTNEYVETIIDDATHSEYTKVERLNQLYVACRDAFIEESA